MIHGKYIHLGGLVHTHITPVFHFLKWSWESSLQVLLLGLTSSNGNAAAECCATQRQAREIITGSLHDLISSSGTMEPLALSQSQEDQESQAF